ncbi:MAG: FKBP-type peptidyl-prolyl cis-trans isomerase [Cellvibrionaceae bacterium]|nr:FKBP-type peptidyl-prolyl cis-trans isomerase [Cellvibrionaceae bacterium]
MNVSIGEGTQVTLHFALKLDNGDLVDSTFDAEPAQFVVGDGRLFESFEKVLFGLTAGVSETFIISPEEGFGQPNPSNIQTFKRSEFGDDIALQKGLIITFADAQNTELPGVVTAVDEAHVIVDFNHPLAGRHIHFEVEIIDVTPVVTH